MRKNDFKVLKVFVYTFILVFIICSFLIIKPLRYNMGIKMIEREDYEKAQNIFENLENYKDSADKVLGTKYQLAIKKIDSGEKESAFAIFKELRNYKDSMKYIKEIKYMDAIELKQKGEYEQGIRVFKALGDFKDSPNQLIETKYEMALFLKREERFKEASKIFEELGEYKDSAIQKNIIYFDSEKFETVKNLLGTSYENMISTYGEIAEVTFGREGHCGKYRHKNADFWIEYSSDNKIMSYDNKTSWIPENNSYVVWIEGAMDCFIPNGTKEISKEDFCKVFPYSLTEPMFAEEQGVQCTIKELEYNNIVFFNCKGWEWDFERSEREGINAIKWNNPVILYGWRIS